MTTEPSDKTSPPPEAAPPAEPPPAPLPPPTTIHEAELESGPSGRVLWGAEIDFDTAVARRQTEQNVFVCGDNAGANLRQAGQIEATVGPCKRSDPHIRHAGPHALPHYQQTQRTPAGPADHTFYETARRKARRKK